MLISRVSETEGRAGAGALDDAGRSSAYRAADEMFKLMSDDIDNEQSLRTRDLVLLYKNIDVGNKVPSNDLPRKAPNQHFETVVYKDGDRESDESDSSEMYCHEDLQDVFVVNSERIDLLTNVSCAQHTLCPKLGDIDMQSNNLTREYDRQFLFKDPYIKQQLKNMNLKSEFKDIDTMLPTSFLDYICCKRLEDNYNFYMDNIIRYVRHTIEQLKRISNGDYLTDKVKEKWREVEDYKNGDATKVLATSVSIPLHVEGKVNGHRSTWDDIVHSEVDVRSLSKILEKKIIIEIPKLICSSYKLFSERCADNLIISCKKELGSSVEQNQDDESRVDVVFQLERSNSGHVISKINSIMILQKLPSITDAASSEIRCKEIEFGNNENHEEYPEIVKLKESISEKVHTIVEETPANCCSIVASNRKASTSDKSDSSGLDNCFLKSSQYTITDTAILNKKKSMKGFKTESDYTLIIPDELRCAIQRLNTQVTPVPEEFEETLLSKKKVSTRVRIKSPYENKSYYLEEKKRKKLLEIREKREKKKMTLNENCKVTKHKYGKAAVMAQPSSSMTKLSITNKSFYNSIYGESLSQGAGVLKKTQNWRKREIDQKRNDVGTEFYSSSFLALNKNPLDDGITETAMQMAENLNTDQCTTPTSAMTNYDTHVNLLSELIASSDTDSSVSDGGLSPCLKLDRNDGNTYEDAREDFHIDDLRTSEASCSIVPANTPKVPKQTVEYQDELKEIATPVECRKSIDKIYDLMKKLGNIDESDLTGSMKYNINATDGQRSSSLQVSDSGTSVKHHIISSNPSNFSFDKNNKTTVQPNIDKKKRGAPSTVVPKVVISSKLQTSKYDSDRSKTDRKRNVSSPSLRGPDNPLKAISQLLHEFDNVQRTRHKTYKKIDHDDGKTSSRQGSSKKTRHEQTKDAHATPVRVLSSKERKSRPRQVADGSQYTHQIAYADDRHASRTPRRNMSDIIDAVKEARGEAVRGPSKPYSRLDTLAQPKKSYVQAHNEEIQSKHGRNVMAHKMQRSPTTVPVGEKSTGYTTARNWRRSPSNVTSTAKPVPPIERTLKPGRSASNSPVRKHVTQQSPETPCKQSTVPVPPEDLKKKMVAVESYVKNHYGLMDTNQPTGPEVHKSRVPLIPNDIELASITSSPTAEESTEIGKKLHYMIDTMINIKAPSLSILAECKESMSKVSHDGLKRLSTHSLLKIEEPKSESDYPVDVFEDKNIVTAVASIPRDKIHEDHVVDGSIDTVESVTYDVQPFSSAMELRKLEKALYQKISVGAFPKRLRIKNLTLTPKQSLQQVIVVQSGDAGSLLVKSSVSQCLTISDSKTDSLRGLKSLGALSNNQMNGGYTGFPVQVATVGYAFPTYQSIQSNSNSPRVKEDIRKNAKFHKTSQCFKGLFVEPCLEQSTQADIVESVPSTHSTSVDTSKQNYDIKTQSDPVKEIGDEAEDIRVSSKVSENCKDALKEEVIHSPGSIDHSTSLDLLMGLLNEIRKLTTETGNDNNINIEKEPSQCKDLEIILNDAAAQENSVDKSRDVIFSTSVEKLEQLESSPNIYSCELSKDNRLKVIHSVNESRHKNVSVNCELRQKVEKEVSVDIEKMYVNRLTDVPSCFLSVKMNHKASNTVVEIVKETSFRSVYTVQEYETLYSNASFDRFLEPPKVDTNADFLDLCHVSDPELSDLSNIEATFISDSDKPQRLHASNVDREEMFCQENTQKQFGNVPCHNKLTTKGARHLIGSETESIMKLKRDVLVTVYSILVFTVFAALSFPKLIYHFDI